MIGGTVDGRSDTPADELDDPIYVMMYTTLATKTIEPYATKASAASNRISLAMIFISGCVYDITWYIRRCLCLHGVGCGCTYLC